MRIIRQPKIEKLKRLALEIIAQLHNGSYELKAIGAQQCTLIIKDGDRILLDSNGTKYKATVYESMFNLINNLMR